MKVNIEPEWKETLADEFEKPYFATIVQNLKQAKAAGRTIYPPGPQIFDAFFKTPFSKVSVLILGQDPYHGPGQAHGLCFSVNSGVPFPPSLLNIFKELLSDIGKPIPAHGDLSDWARQGVLLLNASLTVEAGQPMSHSRFGWELFTDAVIRKVSQQTNHTVFLLWGRFAQQKEGLIDNRKHLILKAAHPSPLSAHNGFFGCRHFSQTNAWLLSKGKQTIDW